VSQIAGSATTYKRGRSVLPRAFVLLTVAWRYPTTVTCQSIGRPGTGVQGVGLHTLGPATNGTSTMADPIPTALIAALKSAAEALVEIKANTRLSEMYGGPGHVPPDMTSPPVSMRVAPTVTQTVVLSSDGCHLTSTVPLKHWELGGVEDVPAASTVAVVVTGTELSGCLDRAEVSDDVHPAIEKATTTSTISRQVTTPAA
jgi:hypothetical protein